jgi:hypothetical protein
MLSGALIVVEKTKNGERQIEQAIQAGIVLFHKHNPKIPAQELVAYVSPRLFEESVEGDYSITVDEHEDVPYPLLWVCLKGKESE